MCALFQAMQSLGAPFGEDEIYLLANMRPPQSLPSLSTSFEGDKIYLVENMRPFACQFLNVSFEKDEIHVLINMRSYFAYHLSFERTLRGRLKISSRKYAISLHASFL